MRALWVTAVLVAVTLAGCADGSQSNTEEEDEFVDIDTKATSTTGVIRGVVFDAAITPIEGATITIRAIEKETQSSPEGAFFFENLEPGSYFLEVTKMGFDKIQTSVNVEAGVDKPPVVKVQLAANPSMAPIAIGHVFDGFIQCSWVAFAAALAMCSVPEPYVDLGDEFITYIDVNGYPDFIQGELQWESTQSLGEALAFSVYDGSTTAPRRTEGVSPQVLSGDRAFWENATGSDKSGSPMVADGEQISWRVFAGAHPSTVPPCAVVVCPWGLGITIEQRLSIYTHVFHNWVPEEGWLFVEDGEPVPPA